MCSVLPSQVENPLQSPAENSERPQALVLTQQCPTASDLALASSSGSSGQAVPHYSRYVNVLYSLNPSLAAACFRLLEFQPQVDCMATARTTKCMHFISRFPEEGNLYTDILSRSLAPLRDNNLFFNPPWGDSPILHLLKVIQEDRISGLLLLPLWPSRPWWPIILQLRASPILILPKLSKRDFRLPTADGRLITKHKVRAQA